jgi:hypothetical protein
VIPESRATFAAYRANARLRHFLTVDAQSPPLLRGPLPGSISRTTTQGNRAGCGDPGLGRLLAGRKPDPGQCRCLHSIQLRIRESSIHRTPRGSTSDTKRLVNFHQSESVCRRSGLRVPDPSLPRTKRAVRVAIRTCSASSLSAPDPARESSSTLRQREGQGTGNAAELMRHGRKDVADQFRAFGGERSHILLISATGQDVPHREVSVTP